MPYQLAHPIYRCLSRCGVDVFLFLIVSFLTPVSLYVSPRLDRREACGTTAYIYIYMGKHCRSLNTFVCNTAKFALFVCGALVMAVLYRIVLYGIFQLPIHHARLVMSMRRTNHAMLCNVTSNNRILCTKKHRYSGHIYMCSYAQPTDK